MYHAIISLLARILLARRVSPCEESLVVVERSLSRGGKESLARRRSLLRGGGASRCEESLVVKSLLGGVSCPKESLVGRSLSRGVSREEYLARRRSLL